MELILGGFAQGKLDFALSRYPDACVFDESDYERLLHGTLCGAVIWNDFHLAVKNLLESGRSESDVEKFVTDVVERCPSIVIISDEIGCGIVPMSADERRYRELVGRLQCLLAKKADAVFRVVCGVPQRIK